MTRANCWLRWFTRRDAWEDNLPYNAAACLPDYNLLTGQILVGKEFVVLYAIGLDLLAVRPL
jgi:hypothetical protein